MKGAIALVVVAGLLLVGAPLDAEAKKKKKRKPRRVERTVTSDYVASFGAPETGGGCLDAVNPCPTISLQRREKFVRVEIADDTGTPTAFLIGQDIDGDELAGEHLHQNRGHERGQEGTHGRERHGERHFPLGEEGHHVRSQPSRNRADQHHPGGDLRWKPEEQGDRKADHRHDAELACQPDEHRLRHADDPREMLLRLRDLLVRHDPDAILTAWGDSFILPRLLELARRYGVPLPLNRDPERAVEYRPARSYFSYGRIVYKTASHLLAGRWHIDFDNAFLIDDYSLDGVFELARISQLPVQRVARVSTGTCALALPATSSATRAFAASAASSPVTLTAASFASSSERAPPADSRTRSQRRRNRPANHHWVSARAGITAPVARPMSAPVPGLIVASMSPWKRPNRPPTQVHASQVEEGRSKRLASGPNAHRWRRTSPATGANDATMTTRYPTL